MNDGYIRSLRRRNDPMPLKQEFGSQRGGVILVGFAAQSDQGDP
jgi:hypothetical protein